MKKVLLTSFLIILSCYNESLYLNECPSARLESITVSDGILEPVFHRDVERYSLFLPCGFDSVNITAISECPDASVTIDGALSGPGTPIQVIFDEYKIIEIIIHTPEEEMRYYIEVIELIEECDIPARQ